MDCFLTFCLPVPEFNTLTLTLNTMPVKRQNDGHWRFVKYGGHLGRHLEFQSYSSLLERLSTQRLLQEV